MTVQLDALLRNARAGPCHPCICVWEAMQAPCPSRMGSRGSCVQKLWALFTSCPGTCEPTRSLWGNEGVRGFLNSWGRGGHMTQVWPIRTSRSPASPWTCDLRGANEGPRGGRLLEEILVGRTPEHWGAGGKRCLCPGKLRR